MQAASIASLLPAQPQFQLQSGPALAFGPFQLYATQKLLLNQGAPVRLGGRAIDLLLALVRQPGQLLSQRELVAQVWPHTVVEDSSLRVHVAALRRALRDGAAGQRYIGNVPGRGYSFLAPVVVLDQAPADTGSALRRLDEGVRLTAMLGRARELACVRARLETHRLVTIAGPGGVGKSTLAMAAAAAEKVEFPGGVLHIDLRTIQHVAGLADAFERMVQTLGAPCAVLLVMDNCEHVIAPAAALAEHLLCRFPSLRILAGSREPLLAEGECVCRIAPLAVPAPGDLTIADGLAYPALELFLDRAREACSTLELDATAWQMACAICARLDGLPLALELAAASIETLGLGGLLEQLEQQQLPENLARRHGPAIHASLFASYAWSYALLADDEQRLMRRLALLDDGFALAAACACAAGIGMTAAQCTRALMALVSKSLLMAEFPATQARYRLLQTARAFTAIHDASLAPALLPLQDPSRPWPQ